MSNRLYVGNISSTLTEAALGGLFSKFGTVESVHIVENRDASRTGRFGFIQLSNEAECKDAIALLDGREIGGCKLRVDHVTPLPLGSDRSYAGAGTTGYPTGFAPSAQPYNKLW
jgi:RNA recognition motif-containing protein